MKIKIFVSLFFIVIISSNIFAGAWTQKRNSGFYKFDFRFLNAKEMFDENGDKADISKFTDYTFSFYSEYGITDNFTINTSIPLYKNLKYNIPSSSSFKTEASGLGDIDVGLRIKLAEFSQSVISGGLNLGIPTGSIGTDGELWTGSGDFNQAVNFQFGHSFYPNPIYSNFLLKFRNRSEGFSDEFFFGLEAGYSFSNSLLLIVRINGLRSLKNGDTNKIGGFGIYQNNQEYIAFGPELIYSINNNWGISASYESGTAAKNIVSAPVFALGVFFKN